MRGLLYFLICFPLLPCISCGNSSSKYITLATTTSTRDTGLLDVLLPAFKQKYGIEVRVVAVGTGQALEIGRRGDADVILTHDPAGEERFITDQFGISRQEVMSNDFVLAGPKDDPAGVKSATSGVDAFRRVAEKQAVFISRGDESGTHQKEKTTWQQAQIEPDGNWYIRAGQGMGAVLRMADEKRGYTLTDRGTYLALRQKLQLEPLFTGDPAWINQYSVLLINPKVQTHIQHSYARQFAEFLVSPEAQQIITDYGREQYGEPLFRPRLASKQGGT